MIDEYLYMLTEKDEYPISIRPIELSEWNILDKLFIEFNEDTNRTSPFKYNDKSSVDRKNDLKKVDHIILVAFRNNEPIGFMVGIKKQAPNGQLKHVHITKKYRGLNVAKDLWNKLFEWFKMKKRPNIQVGCFSQNYKALAFYKSVGFIEEFTLLRHKSSKGMRI